MRIKGQMKPTMFITGKAIAFPVFLYIDKVIICDILYVLKVI